jgi:hypothetical protein
MDTNTELNEEDLLSDHDCTRIVIDCKLIKAGFDPFFDVDQELNDDLIKIIEEEDGQTWNFLPEEVAFLIYHFMDDCDDCDAYEYGDDD